MKLLIWVHANGVSVSANDGFPEEIEFIDGIEKALEIILRLADSFTQYLDGCFDSTGPYFIVNSGLIWNKIIQLRKTGIRLRYITEITKENIFSCRKLMTHVEVRHIEGIKGNFGISDGKSAISTLLKTRENHQHR